VSSFHWPTMIGGGTLTACALALDPKLQKTRARERTAGRGLRGEIGLI
jgi:hypothetical protein